MQKMTKTPGAQLGCTVYDGNAKNARNGSVGRTLECWPGVIAKVELFAFFRFRRFRLCERFFVPPKRKKKGNVD